MGDSAHDLVAALSRGGQDLGHWQDTRVNERDFLRPLKPGEPNHRPIIGILPMAF
jgi:hypothetical protein